MKRLYSAIACTVSVASIALGWTVFAQEGEGLFTGEIRLGFRAVSTDGVASKYAEHINLQDGPRLFDFNLLVEPPGGRMAEVFDQLTLTASNLGGDPYEAAQLRLRKYGSYDFKYARRESTYFYADIIVPRALSDVSTSNLGDLHTFDLRRAQDSASLGLDLTNRDKLTFAFNRFTREGNSTTTLDIGRDEFEFDAPISESLNDYEIAYEHAWDKVTLTLREQVRDFDNSYEAFLPGASSGEGTTDPTSLNRYFVSQPYDLENLSHTVLLSARPSDRVIVRALFNAQQLELDAVYDESGDGTTGDFGSGNPPPIVPAIVDTDGIGRIERDATMAEIDVSFLVNDRLALVGSVRQQDWDQKGDYTIDGTVDPPALGDPPLGTSRGVWDYSTTGFDAGAQFQVNPQLMLTGGVRLEQRDARFGAFSAGATSTPLTLTQHDTDHDGLFVDLGWTPNRHFDLQFDYESNSYDDPFTFSSPTDGDRLRLKARYRWESGLWARASLSVQTWENSTPPADLNGDGTGGQPWDAEYTQTRVEFGYTSDWLTFTTGYSVFDTEREIGVEVPFGFAPGSTAFVPVFYDQQTDMGSMNLVWNPDGPWRLGSDFHAYDNEGSFAVEFQDLAFFVAREFARGFLVRCSYRTIDYDETRFGFNDYDASLLELSTGMRW